MSQIQSANVGCDRLEIQIEEGTHRIPSDGDTGILRRESAIDQFVPNLHQQSWKGLTRTSAIMYTSQSHAQELVQYLKQGTLFKLTVHADWVSKNIALSETDLLISDNIGRTDFIPLHEVCGTSLSRFLDPHDTMQRASSESHSPPGTRSSESAARKPSRRISASSTRTRNSILFDNRIFDVQTIDGGRHSGRTFTFKADSSQESGEWLALLSSQSKKRIKVVEHKTFVHGLQSWARRTYAHPASQTSVALLIFFNFVVNAYQAENDPSTMVSSDAEGSSFYALSDAILTSIFLLELLFNAFGHWFWAFVCDPWNVFDAIIVLLSLVSLLVNSVPGLNVLRVLRAFRLLRLIKRFRSLRRIFNALVLSIVPVLNAFVICVLVTFIYTILGVFIFSKESPKGFGTFNRSLLTHFLLLAMQQWPEEIKLLSDEGNINVVAFFYLFSFVAIALWTCLQVVVAVLLDNFLTATFEEKKDEAIRKQLENRRQGSPLDALLNKLTQDFDTEDDLRKDIHAVFMILDEDDSGAISNEEMVIGFAKIEVTPRIRMSSDDVEAMKHHSLGHRQQEELTWEQFEMMIRIELRTYMQRMMHDAFIISNGDPSILAMLGGLKLSLLDLPVGYLRTDDDAERQDTAALPVEAVRGNGNSTSKAGKRARVPVPLFPRARPSSSNSDCGHDAMQGTPPIGLDQATKEQLDSVDERVTGVSSRVQDIERKVDAMSADMQRLNLSVTSGMAQILSRLNQLDPGDAQAGNRRRPSAGHDHGPTGSAITLPRLERCNHSDP